MITSAPNERTYSIFEVLHVVATVPAPRTDDGLRAEQIIMIKTHHALHTELQMTQPHHSQLEREFYYFFESLLLRAVPGLHRSLWHSCPNKRKCRGLNERFFGFGASRLSGIAAYSADAPKDQNSIGSIAITSSPGENSSPKGAETIVPARSVPGILGVGSMKDEIGCFRSLISVENHFREEDCRPDRLDSHRSMKFSPKLAQKLE
jgi:hypothetical protein